MKTDNRLGVVLGTNVLLVSVSSRSKYHWIFDSLMQAEYDMYITNEILIEYEEIIARKLDVGIAVNIVRTLLLLPNVYRVNVYYNWNLITIDPDDNKFIDCAISVGADCLVTHDTHFNVVKYVDFPRVNVIDTAQFRKILKDCS